MDTPRLDTGPAFEVTTEQDGETHHVRLRGELDLAVAHVVEQELSGAVLRAPAVIVDLSELTFIDSTGLRVILMGHQGALQTGCALTLIPGPPPVQRVFEISGVESMLSFRDA